MSNYDELATNSSYDKLKRKQSKTVRKPKKKASDEFDLASIPDSYLGNEAVWDDLSEELEELYG
jgi:hypothetical protein